jgi:hypothetical protein
MVNCCIAIISNPFFVHYEIISSQYEIELKMIRSDEKDGRSFANQKNVCRANCNSMILRHIIY